MNYFKEVLDLVPKLYYNMHKISNSIFVDHTGRWMDFCYDKKFNEEFLSLNFSYSFDINEHRINVYSNNAKIELGTSIDELLFNDEYCHNITTEEIFQKQMLEPAFSYYEDIKDFVIKNKNSEIKIILIDLQFSTEQYEKIVEFSNL